MLPVSAVLAGTGVFSRVVGAARYLVRVLGDVLAACGTMRDPSHIQIVCCSRVAGRASWGRAQILYLQSCLEDQVVFSCTWSSLT